MPIPESQLSTWTNIGAVTTAKTTHEAIERAIRRSVQTVDFEVYLQGSYRNSTNIYGDSDVDVVVQLNSTFSYDLSSISSAQQLAFQLAYPSPASYRWADFQRDIYNALITAFGSAAVTAGSKCLKVTSNSGRLACDVVPALQYRNYRSFAGIGAQDLVEGITLWSQPDGRQIVNFPKPHYKNGTIKHSATSSWFKPTVRMLKNARNAAAARGYMQEDSAPSYFVECFVYNAPSWLFGPTCQESYRKVVEWWSNSDLSSMLCQNEVTPLFGRTPETWSEAGAKELITGLALLWNNW